MSDRHPTFSVRLFYSYCHRDERYRSSMEVSLALLKNEGILKDWSDRKILPGEKISEKIRKEMDKADIIVFLISKEFIASAECMREWEYAKELNDTGKSLFRIPIILKDCSWQDMLDGDDVKALPKDGTPIARYDSEDEAWQEVYEGIKGVISQMGMTFAPRPEFLEKMQKTDFLSQHHIKLQDIFVFLTLSGYTKMHDNQALEEEIVREEEILNRKHVLIHGEEMSGKTALGRHLFLYLVEKESPVLHVNLEAVSRRPQESIFQDAYHNQFNGDYCLWKNQENKTLILDNLSSARNSLDLVDFSKDFFDRIIVISASDVFISFFRDEVRLADFYEMKINPLTHSQQEKLIRKRWELSNHDESITDSRIDQIEGHINAMLTDKIVPRYPFYVLSILQTYEGYMPSDLSITSYGHCYYVLILANLVKAGISHKDISINACFNFAENLAFKLYQNNQQRTDTFNFDQFLKEYGERYIELPKSTLNRLKGCDYEIINKEGHFKTSYMYYFFLGKFLAKDRKKHKSIIEQMSRNSHMISNYLTLLFVIHHTEDDQIIDDILIRTMCTLDTVRPAVLDKNETKEFGDILAKLPENILSQDSVEEERKKEREFRERSDREIESENNAEETGDEDIVNDCYRILKNNEILGQILRNKCGNLEKSRVKEIVETVADSGLRLINFILKDQKLIIEYARYLQRKHSEDDLDKIRNYFRFSLFLWTIINVEKIVSAVNYPEIREIVKEVVEQQETPAYSLIGYFSGLDSAVELTKETKRELASLLKKHDNPFLKRVISLRTQHYINTHRSKAPIEQSICSLLRIEYTPRR